MTNERYTESPWIGVFVGREPHKTFYPEKSLDLGQSRLLVSSNLGSGFTNLLEQEELILPTISHPMYQQIEAAASSEINYQKGHKAIIFEGSESQKAVASFLRMVKWPMSIIGVNLEALEIENLDQVYQRLNAQMGLPSHFRVSALGDRIAGREQDFVIVLLGLNQLPKKQQERLQRDMRKGPLGKTLRIFTFPEPQQF